MAITKTLRYEILRRDKNACKYCHANDVPLQIDHVVPLALGGTDKPENLVAACRDCNGGKKASPPDSALVADVDADALRWARAMSTVTQQAQEDRWERYRIAEEFQHHWKAVMLPNTAMDDDWEQSLTAFQAAGLTEDDLLEATEIAARKYNLAKWQRWKYFCGVCYGMIRQRQEAARRLVEATD